MFLAIATSLVVLLVASGDLVHILAALIVAFGALPLFRTILSAGERVGKSDILKALEYRRANQQSNRAHTIGDDRSAESQNEDLLEVHRSHQQVH